MPMREVFEKATCSVCGVVFEFRRTSSRPRKICGSPECKRKLSSITASKTNRVHASKRMKANNPMHSAETREKVAGTLRAIGHKPSVRRGNGTGATPAEAAMLASLGPEWTLNVIVPTKIPMGEGYPTHYKLDLGIPELKVGLEVDGGSHCSIIRMAQDRKKTEFLRGRGWTVFRVTNREALEENESTTLRLKEAIRTLRTAS